MDTELLPSFSELEDLRQEIISLVQENENSVEEIIRAAASTHQSIECKYQNERRMLRSHG